MDLINRSVSLSGTYRGITRQKHKNKTTTTTTTTTRTTTTTTKKKRRKKNF
jgi:hypothetical protein